VQDNRIIADMQPLVTNSAARLPQLQSTLIITSGLWLPNWPWTERKKEGHAQKRPQKNVCEYFWHFFLRLRNKNWSFWDLFFAEVKIFRTLVFSKLTSFFVMQK
jgi:hypothetical protein